MFSWNINTAQGKVELDKYVQAVNKSVKDAFDKNPSSFLSAIAAEKRRRE